MHPCASTCWNSFQMVYEQPSWLGSNSCEFVTRLRHEVSDMHIHDFDTRSSDTWKARSGFYVVIGFVDSEVSFTCHDVHVAQVVRTCKACRYSSRIYAHDVQYL